MAAAARLAKLGHEVTLLERSAEARRRPGEVERDGFAWDAGPTSTLLPAVVRDLFRKSGRPLERELEPVPLDVSASTASRTALARAAGRVARRADRGLRRARPGLGRAAGSTTSPPTPRTGRCCAASTSRTALGPRRAPRASSPPLLDGREIAAQAAAQAFRDDRLRLVAGAPVRGGWPRPAQRARLAGRGGLPRAAVRRLDRHRRHGRARPTRSTARMSTRGVDRATGAEATDLVVRTGRVVAVATAAGELDADVVVCAVDPAGCPRWRRTSSAPCRRSRRWSATSASRHRCPTCRTRWCCTATRCSWCAPAAGRRRGRRVDGARPRPAGRGHAPRAGPAPARRARRRSSPGSTARRATWSSSGAARRSACCGRAGRRSVAGSGPRPRSPGSTPPARTPPPAPGCRSSGSRRRSSPRPSARP